MKHLIFDVNVIIDYWFQERSAASTLQLLHPTPDKSVKLWIVASQLHTLHYTTRAVFKRKGLDADSASSVTRQLLTTLLEKVEVLSNHGFEQADIYLQAQDFEDAQIAAAARSLSGQNVCVVTEDKKFDDLGEVIALEPAQAISWLQNEYHLPTETSPLPFIDLVTQQAQLRPHLEKGIETVLRHGQYIMGPEVKQLEEKLAAYTGAKHCITVASGTEALLISLMAIGIKPGDEVITTAFSFIATAEVIVLLGAKPVFIDIEPDTCNINAALIEAKITDKTKAIMPVSLYGQPADMDEINAIAARHGNIPVIEDAAQSFGATYKGKKSCNLSTIGCTSFFPSKPLGCYGDGGAIFTNDDHLAQAMREIRVHGQSKRYVHTRIGVGGRMDTLQCAVVLAKLERFDWEIQQRIEIGARYSQLLEQIPKVQQLAVREGISCIWGQYTIQVDNREKVLAELNNTNTPTAVHYPIPMHQQSAYKDFYSINSECNIAEAVSNRVFSLPMHIDLSLETQLYIVNTLAEVIA